MQFQVPQFIESEDKLVGPFSLRQFLYIAGAGAISAVLYFTIGGVVAVFLSVIIIGAAFGFAFVKIGGRPLLDVFLAAVNFYWKPQMYVWKSENASSVGRVSAHHAEGESSLATSIESIASGVALHKSLANLQTGDKISDKELIERKMESRYQIFHRIGGDRAAARRIDYR